MLKKYQETKPDSGVWPEIGSHETSKGQPFWIIPGGIGPGDGSFIAFASTKQYDVVVEELVGEEGHPLDKTNEQGILPSRSLPQFLEAVLAFIAHQPVGPP